jgi:hypothetical protein
MKPWLSAVCLLAAVLLLSAGAAAAAEKHYVGSRVCGSCHAEEYRNFTAYAKKSHSFKAVEKMAPWLTATEINDCYGCHTTGYGRPGGFQSPETTPELKDAGCEVCHGPGSAHVESGDPSELQLRPSIKLCESCHTSTRVQAFNYRPLIHGGAH